MIARVLRRLGLDGRTAVIAVPYLWLLMFFLVPFAIVLKISFSDAQISMPPYQPLLHWVSDKALQIQLNFGNFAFLVEDNLYWKAYLNSIWVAVVSTLLCLLIGYPMAYAIARSQSSTRNVLLLLVILPFWTSFLLRVYAWIGILKNNGLINNTLMALGVIDQPIQIRKLLSRPLFFRMPIHAYTRSRNDVQNGSTISSMSTLRVEGLLRAIA